MRRNIFFVLFSFLVTAPAFTQVTIGSNNPPDAAAVLDLQSSSKGFLLPRLTTTQRNQIVQPPVGLQIYNLTTNCVEIYMPISGWNQWLCDCQTLPSANFTYSPQTIGIGSNVSFSTPTTGVTYAWTFQGGNPASSNLQNPTVQWTNTGSYTVTLVVTLPNGCFNSFSVTITVANCPPGSQTFNYTGGVQNFVVPGCVSQVTIQALGAQGGPGNPSVGGQGGSATGTLTVTPGETLYVYVGQMGSQGGGPTFGGGGSGGPNSRGAGGGASDVRRGGQTLNHRVIVAGGGGGGGSSYNGGAGGGTTGSPGLSPNGDNGGGGTQSAGGNDGACSGACGSGTFGIGANGAGGSCNAAGGGGGWYGGGTCTTGGGGSGYTTGLSNASMQNGVRQGNGQVTISW